MKKEKSNKINNLLIIGLVIVIGVQFSLLFMLSGRTQQRDDSLAEDIQRIKVQLLQREQ